MVKIFLLTKAATFFKLHCWKGGGQLFKSRFLVKALFSMRTDNPFIKLWSKGVVKLYPTMIKVQFSLNSMQTCAFLFYYRLLHWLLLYCSVSSFEAIFCAPNCSWLQNWLQKTVLKFWRFESQRFLSLKIKNA